MNDATPHQVKRMPRDFGGLKKGEIVLVPSVRIVDDFIRSIPADERMSIAELRQALARRHDAETTCPVYTGYHLRTVAEAAYEAHRAAGARCPRADRAQAFSGQCRFSCEAARTRGPVTAQSPPAVSGVGCGARRSVSR